MAGFEESEIRKRVADSDLTERDRILAEHKSDVRDIERRTNLQFDSQKDKLAAKLAARKKMREELEKDRAVNEEMSRISVAQVKIYDLQMTLMVFD